MSASNARIVFKRGSAALFGSLSYQQQPRSALRSFSRLIPDPNISAMVQCVSKEEMQKEHNFSLQRQIEKDRVAIEKIFSGIYAENEKIRSELRYMRSMMLARKEKMDSELSKAIDEDTSLVTMEIRALDAKIEEAPHQLMKCSIGAGLIFGAGLALSVVGHERA